MATIKSHWLFIVAMTASTISAAPLRAAPPDSLAEAMRPVDPAPAAALSLSVKGERPGSLELWVHTSGSHDFTILTAVSLTNWQTYATVFSREDPIRIRRDWGAETQQEPLRLYQASFEVKTPAEMALQWQAPENLAPSPPVTYAFTLERSCFCFPKALTGRVVVENGIVTRVENVEDDGEPISNSNLEEFRSINQLFELVESNRGSADLIVVRLDPVWRFPTWIYIDRLTGATDDEVTYRITDVSVIVPEAGAKP